MNSDLANSGLSYFASSHINHLISFNPVMKEKDAKHPFMMQTGQIKMERTGGLFEICIRTMISI